LLCGPLCRAFNQVFAVRRFFAVHFSGFTGAHGKERLHGSACFSGSENWNYNLGFMKETNETSFRN
jgi:hypothetical protein